MDRLENGWVSVFWRGADRLFSLPTWKLCGQWNSNFQFHRPDVISTGFGPWPMVNIGAACLYNVSRYISDVLDVAWSPQDVWLATCSIDNTIVVWNANKLPGTEITVFVMQIFLPAIICFCVPFFLLMYSVFKRTSCISLFVFYKYLSSFFN